ncbi:hypothetical protein SBOR_1997 [Sclerotinia borealis F-4128]|uniref:LysM domain-containing protein n=1 Tax=Sclerotinia borealis (strain F-4128) TaxID=1432307 RepID=W9CP10_SCLBF|nr:hypothetical protein SBOR_1997 [Sclerotinia borealis F-4128]
MGQDDLQDKATYSLDVMDIQGHEGTTPARHGDLPTSLDARKDKTNYTTTTIRSPSLFEKKNSPQVTLTEAEVVMEVDIPDVSLEDLEVKSDSEAETIVLPGKDGHSPSKIRKLIKHEDKSDDEDIRKPSELRKRDTFSLDAPFQKENHGRRKRLRPGVAELSGISKSHLSNGKASNLQDKRHSSLPKFPAPELRIHKSPSPPAAIHDKAKSVDGAFPRDEQKTSESGDDHVDHEDRKAERHRSSAFSRMQSKENTPTLIINAESTSRVTKEGSESPHHRRSHKRSNSTQFPPKPTHASSHKKGRIPNPLQFSEYQSDDSSASGRSYPRSSRPRQRTIHTAGESTMSPAAFHPPRKRVDGSGATTLLNLVRKNNISGVTDELGKHPSDLNVGDNALITPLHAASLEGFVKIARMLLIKGCTVDMVNLDGDTPLHDAIENGHVEVVKLLLEHGANPRKAKKMGGDEPSDLAAAYNGDDKTREDLQQLIEEAKIKNDASGNTLLGYQTTEESADHDSYTKHSPRHSPTSEYPSGSSRMRARSNKTTDQDLYRDLSKVDMLREACQNGDHSNVSRWLDVNQSRKDAKSLLIAAKAGDNFAVQLLLGIGNFDRDPEPLKGEDPRWSTPMLCAIDKGHIDVINCLLSGDFDPTKRWHNKTYYEIAQERERGSHNYEVVVETLKEAFSGYSKPVKSSPSKSRSPKLLRDTDRGRDHKRPLRAARDLSSSSRKRSPSKTTDKGTDSQKGQHGSGSSLRQSHNAQNQARRGPGRPRKEENDASHPTSDTESTPLGPPKRKLQAPKVTEPDAAAMSSENEPTKPRRKLVSGKELKGERDKQRRGSITSNVSTTSVTDRRGVEELKNTDSKHKNTSIARPSEPADEEQISKHSSAEATPDKGERHDKIKGTRRDNSKDRLASIRNDKSPIKRQRRSTTPPRTGTHDIMAATDVDGAPSKRRKLEGPSKHVATEENSTNSHIDHPVPNLDVSSSQDKMSPKVTKEKPSKIPTKGTGECETSSNHENEEAQAAKTNSVDLERKKQVKSTREAREAQKAEEAKQQAKEAQEAAREAEDKRAREKETREAREAQEAEEAQEKLVIEEETAKRAQEEEDRKVRQAQEERDKAEQRRLYDEQKRIDREKLEQNRAAAQERERLEKARQAREKEAERLSKLPHLLREFDQLQQAKTPRIASLSKFRTIKGYRYDTIRPRATGHPNAREQWMLNTDVALLLGEKDLELSRYTAWERIPLEMDLKASIWPLVLAKYSFGLPLDILPLSERGSTHLPEDNAKLLFFGLDLFFVKVSEFMFIVPSFPHLRGLEMAVEYQELVPLGTPPVNKYEQDLDYDPSNPFWPAPQRYIDGSLVIRSNIETKTSTKPFPESKAPRRELSRLFPNEKELVALARSQRLYNSGLNYRKSPPGIGPHDHDQENGITPPHSNRSRSLNEEGLIQETMSETSNLLHHLDLSNGAPSIPNGIAMHEAAALRSIIRIRKGTNEMYQESCCTCARLLALIGRSELGNGLGSGPPSYLASIIGCDSNSSSFGSRKESLSGDEKENGDGNGEENGEMKEEGTLSEKTAMYTDDREKDGQRNRERLCNGHRDRETADWRFESGDLQKEKEDGIWREGAGTEHRRLSCCERIICGECIEGNGRFRTYCPFCQVRSGGILDGVTTLDSTRSASIARDGHEYTYKPPSYESLHHHPHISSPSSPPYPQKPQTQPQPQPQPEDPLHYLNHATDSMTSLSLRYNIPLDILRRKNGITSDHLLSAKKTVRIPREWCNTSVSLSPGPVEGEEELRRKGCVRRFMVGCKVAEYDIAVLYLEQANYDLELAMGVYKDDERWERDNPILDKGKGKGKTKVDVGRRRFTGQRS